MKQLLITFVLTLMSAVVFASPDLEKEKAASQKFIDQQAKIAKTEQSLSGLLYRSLKEGKGVYPTDADTVTVEYKGTLRTGKVFDASPKGKPISFALTGVIPCWTEAIKKMRVGGSAVLVCPSYIAYGDKGMGPIPGGAALKFEVKLLDIKSF